MRQIVLDTETTGLRPSEGHRVIEIAAIEIIDYLPTGKTYQQYAETFDNLGDRLIGESLLYTNPKTTRRQFEFAKLAPEHPIYQDALSGIPSEKHGENLWARRSIFFIDTNPLMITETYLPDCPPYPG